ncbi:MAG: class I SAM-dependent methyltransferase [Patescibacteria group bacterium]
MKNPGKFLSACPVCKTGKDFDFLMNASQRGKSFSLYLCKECQVQFWHPMKNPGGVWYERNNPYKVRDIEGNKVYRGYHKKFLERSENLPKSFKILDLGCGAGEFIYELSKKGFDVFGIDFDGKAIEIAKERFGLKNVSADSFENFFKKSNSKKFDVITFFEVLEHLDNHREFIENLKKVLKPGGRMALSTPSRERVLANWNKWDFPPHHFTRWNKKSIENIFSKNGFKLDFIDYVETFKITMGAIDGKLRSGLVQKSLNNAKDEKGLLLPNVLYWLAKLKQWILAGIPGLFLWLFGKITKRNNGIMYIEMTHE